MIKKEMKKACVWVDQQRKTQDIFDLRIVRYKCMDSTDYILSFVTVFRYNFMI